MLAARNMTDKLSFMQGGYWYVIGFRLSLVVTLNAMALTKQPLEHLSCRGMGASRDESSSMRRQRRLFYDAAAYGMLRSVSLVSISVFK
jgi:hypothetical protein